MTGTEEPEAYPSAWRADQTRQMAVGDPWAPPIQRPSELTDHNEGPSVHNEGPPPVHIDESLVHIDESRGGNVEPHGDADWGELPADGDDMARPAADDERDSGSAIELPADEAAQAAPDEPAGTDGTLAERETAPWPFVTGRNVTGRNVTDPNVTDPNVTGPFATGPFATGPNAYPPHPQSVSPPPAATPPSWPPMRDARPASSPDSGSMTGPAPATVGSARVPVTPTWSVAPAVRAPGVYAPGPPAVPPQPWPSPAGGTIASGRDAPGHGRRHSTGVVVAVGVIAAVLFGAAGVFLGTRLHGSAGKPSAVGPSATEARVNATPKAPELAGGVTLGDGRGLLAKIVPAPASAHVYNVDDSTNGVMNLNQYVKHYFRGDQTEQNRLRQEGFRVAASTDYTIPDGLEVATHLVQFADAHGAQSYFDDERSAWDSDGSVTSTFDVPSTADGVGYEIAKVDSRGNRRTVLYEHVGNVVVVVNAYTTGQINQSTDSALLHDQVTALN